EATVRLPGSGTDTLPMDGTYLIAIASSGTLPEGYALTLGGPAGSAFAAVGTTIQSNGQPLAGVTITFTRVAGSGAVPAPVMSDVNGTWGQTGFAAGKT